MAIAVKKHAARKVPAKKKAAAKKASHKAPTKQGSTQSAQQTYLIIHDHLQVLVGAGGMSGGFPRQGYYFPSGTCESSDNRLKEETGINTSQIKYINKFSVPGVANVTFIVAKTASVVSLTRSAQRPASTNNNNSPFAELLGLPLDHCWEDSDFHANADTQVFGKGLEYACNKGYI